MVVRLINDETGGEGEDSAASIRSPPGRVSQHRQDSSGSPRGLLVTTRSTEATINAYWYDSAAITRG